MNRRALIVFVILNIAISVGVALLVIVLWQSMQEDQVPLPDVQVFEVVVTATPGPTQTPWIVTVQSAAAAGPQITPGPGEPTVAPTLNQDILPGIATNAAETQTAIVVSGTDEQTYVVQDGDSPSTIAEAYEIPLDDFLCANDLGTIDEPEFIFPGQVLIIPPADFVCDPVVVVADTETPEPTETEGEIEVLTEADLTPKPEDDEGTPAVDAAEVFPTVAASVPTVTLAPTAANAQVVIVQVIGAGDVTREGIEIRNQGGLVDMQGWTMSDAEGNTFTFPDYRLFSNGSVTVFSRVGEDTAAALFWDQTRAVWQAGDVVTLTNTGGVVQSTLRIGADG